VLKVLLFVLFLPWCLSSLPTTRRRIPIFIGLKTDNVGAMTWVVLVIVSLLLAIGMSWSHIRRRLTGQVDIDDVDEN